ncbi:MAG: metallophosphoesterase family protein [Sphingomonadales bacterium]|jgi:serine/threonine protein phosphatase 1
MNFIRRLFGVRDKGEELHDSQHAIPDQMRLYAIGDIHGRLDLLEKLLHEIEQDSTDYHGEVTVVFLGDYVDRGPQSKQVLDYLVQLKRQEEFKTVFLLGNHEQTMLDFMADVRASEHWLRYGGIETLNSYDVQISSEDLHDESLERIRSELRRNLPAAHMEFLRGLRQSYELGDYYFAHAGVRPDIPLSAQVLDDLLWVREPFLSSNADFGRIVVHGHSISEEPVVRSNRIGIDTGAFASGRLTALVLEGNTRKFLITG